MNKHQINIRFIQDKQLLVEGKRVRTQPDSFWAYYSGNVGLMNIFFFSMEFFSFVEIDK